MAGDEIPLACLDSINIFRESVHCVSAAQARRCAGGGIRKKGRELGCLAQWLISDLDEQHYIAVEVNETPAG